MSQVGSLLSMLTALKSANQANAKLQHHVDTFGAAERCQQDVRDFEEKGVSRFHFDEQDVRMFSSFLPTEVRVLQGNTRDYWGMPGNCREY